MKNLLLICLVAVLSIGVCSAQEKKKKSKKAIATIVLTTNIDCGSCVKKVMDNVHILGRGIKDIKTDFPASQDITVFYDERKNSVDNIIDGLDELDVKATLKVVKGCNDGCSKK